MTSNRLKLNVDQMQFIILGTRQQLIKINCKSICLNGIDIQLSTQATCLQDIFESKLKFDIHIRRLAEECLYYQLLQLRTVCSTPAITSARLLVHAFIVCCIDYCNSVLIRISAVQLQRLKVVMSAVIAQMRKFDAITAIFLKKIVTFFLSKDI